MTRRLGLSQSKVLILRIPIEWWDQLQALHGAGHPPEREMIRQALETFLRKNKLL